LAVGGALLGAVPSAAVADDAPNPGTVVFIGVSGLSWNDIGPDTTPNLWQLIDQPGTVVGGLLNRTVRAGSCPADGWLTVGAGVRAAEVAPSLTSDLQAPDPNECGELAEPAAGALTTWSTYVAAAAGTEAEGKLGSLAAWLDQMGLSSTAIGPGAALALADAAGRVSGYVAAPPAAAGLAEAVTAALAGGSNLVLVDAGTRSNTAGLAELDQRVAAAAQAAAGHQGSVYVASIADYGDPAIGLLAWLGGAGAGAETPAGRLWSNAVRIPGLALLPQVTAQLEAGLIPAPVGPVSPWEAAGAGRGDSAAPRAAYFQDLSRHAEAMRHGTQVAYLLVCGLAALGLGLPLLAAARGWRRRLEWLGLVAGSLPVAGFIANLTPWWRCPYPLAAWAVASLAIAGAIGGLVAGLRRLLPWATLRSPVGAPGAIGLLTAAVLAADLLVGQAFALAAPLGRPLLDAKRLYGFGNPAFALFGTGAILAVALLAGHAWRRAHNRAVAATALLVGLVAVVFDGAPWLGADFGGCLALIPAFAVLALLGADVKVTWRRVALVGLAALAGVAVVAVADYLRGPANWTHIGGFVDSILHGGAWEILQRKAGMWLRLSGGVVIILALVALVVWLARRRGLRLPVVAQLWRTGPMVRPVAWALLVLWLVGTLVNDSGAVVAGLGLTLAGPLFAAAVARQRGVLTDDRPAGSALRP
jgi:hypothetical protein